MVLIDRVPRLRAVGAEIRLKLLEKLDGHRAYVQDTGDDLPEVRNWRWNGVKDA